jgi:hypothetical protein
MPVPVIPICAVSCCLPRPICEYKEPVCFLPPPPPQNQSTPPQNQSTPLQIQNYYPGIPEPSTGSILTNSSTTIPLGYLLADGAEVSRTTYAALFLAIGSYYGDGDGSTTFNVPNLSCDSTSSVISYIIKT